ncbi:MAG: putative zinc-binding protein [Thermoplasmata archaeon]
MKKDEDAPMNAIFCCFGCMSSVGTLTGVAVLEAYRKMDQKKTGLFCTSAIAAGVPKHMETTKRAKVIIAIDGCYNKCSRKILEKAGLRIDRYLNLLQDLKIPKIGLFKPFDYKEEDLKRTVREILRLCEGENG